MRHSATFSSCIKPKNLQNSCYQNLLITLEVGFSRTITYDVEVYRTSSFAMYRSIVSAFLKFSLDSGVMQPSRSSLATILLPSLMPSSPAGELWAPEASIYSFTLLRMTCSLLSVCAHLITALTVVPFIFVISITLLILLVFICDSTFCWFCLWM